LPDVDDVSDIYEHVREWLDKEGRMHDLVVLA
jgi:hypothetical protein